MHQEIRGFRTIFTVVGVIYMLLASSMLVRGGGALRQFAVPEELVTALVLEDIFLFFYQLMLFGWTVRGRRNQAIVAGVLCVASLFFAWHDLVTSDSRFGNHLYKGEATLVFVYIGLAYAATFGWLCARGLRPQRAV